MKVKLLKKIRKQYSIVYYPNGLYGSDEGLIHIDKYLVETAWRSRFFSHGYYTKQQAIDRILIEVREKYKEYSVKNKKISYKGIKVWYNK